MIGSRSTDCRSRPAFAALAIVRVLLAAGTLLGASNPLSATQPPETLFILDGSGSMWGPAGDQTKIEAARAVMAEVVPSLDPAVKVGLIAYGHRRKGDCSDIEVLVPAGSDDRRALLDRVRAVQPKGKTPISDAVTTAVGLLKTKEAETTIVLVSDGIETCAADPCAVMRKLKATGIRFVLHVVGFGVDTAAESQLRCMAEAAGGRYFGAPDVASLRAALGSVGQEVAQKVEAARSTPRAAGSGLPKIVVTMPASAAETVAGLRILKADGSPMKETKGVVPESVHPVPPGVYDVSYLLKQPNYGDPTEAVIGRVELALGETRELDLGSIAFNVAEPLAERVAWIERLVVADAGSGEPVATVFSKGNGYYTFKPKPLLGGVYDVWLHYDNSPAPIRVAAGIAVAPGEETVVTLDSGLAFQEVAQTPITGWDLVPLEASGTAGISLAEEDGSTAPAAQPILQARPPSFGNPYSLWMPYIVPPGSYRLLAYVEGMGEPLPVASKLEIRRGEMLQFDSGL